MNVSRGPSANQNFPSAPPGPEQHHEANSPHEFAAQHAYIDPNWNSLLMNNNDILYDMEFPQIQGATPSNSIVQSIQYQNPVAKDDKEAEDGSSQSSGPPQSGGKPAPKVGPKPPKIRPCDHCRRKKTKCVLVPGTNNCVQCESKSVKCTFAGQATKRKGPELDQPMPKRNEIIAPNVPIRDVAPIQDYSVMNNSLLKKTLSLQFPRSSFYVGPTSYIYDINLLNMIIDAQNKPTSGASGRIEQVNLSDSISLRKVSDKVQFVLKDDQSPQSYQTMSNDVDTIEKFVAPHGQILIDLYFRIIHPSYPILHKKVFLEKYSRTHREFSAPLLAAVYVLAIQWWDYDPALNKFPKPNVEHILRIGLSNYLSEILKRPKLSAVQAGLLLLQCKHIVRITRHNRDAFGSDKTSSYPVLDYSDWVICAQVISLAEELGLGLDCNNWKLPKWERGLRKRLAWAVYVEDKWLSLKNSRPSHIHENNWVVVSLAEEDFPEKHGDGDLKEGSSDIDNGKKLFMNFISLSEILSDIVSQFYSMKAMRDLQNDVPEILKLAKPLQLRLRDWYHSVPKELQMSSVQPRKLCSNGYLQLAYFATELTLHRKIVTAIYNAMQIGKPPPAEMVTVCRSAARTRLLAAIDFVKDLKPEHIHSFWHSSSSSNFTLIGTFASLLFVSSNSKEESLFYRDQIFNYRWILKISSKGFDQVGDALAQLDLVLNHIPGLLNDNSDVPAVVPTVKDGQRPLSAANAESPRLQRRMTNTSTASQSPFGTTVESRPYQPRTNTSNPSARARNTATSPFRVNNPSGSSFENMTPGFSATATFSVSTGNTRNGVTYANSPASSQGISPHEVLTRQAVHSQDGASPRSARSKPNSPMQKSPLNTRSDCPT